MVNYSNAPLDFGSRNYAMAVKCQEQGQYATAKKFFQRVCKNNLA